MIQSTQEQMQNQMPQVRQADKITKATHEALIAHADLALAAKKFNGHPAFLALLEELKALHIAKGSDYSNPEDILANLRAARLLGLSPLDGVVVRLADKFERMRSLIRKRRIGEGPAVTGESLRDTLIDLAAYGLLATIFLDEEIKQEAVKP